MPSHAPPLPSHVPLTAIPTDCSPADRTSQVLSAIEFLDAESYDLVTGPHGGARRPLERACRHYMVVELHGSHAGHDEHKLEAFLQRVMESGAVVDGTIAQDDTQSQAIWRVREGITAALAHVRAHRTWTPY